METGNKTKVRLLGTYRWPMHVVPRQPVLWDGLDLSAVLGKPPPGFCAYYGSYALDFVRADAALCCGHGHTRTPTHQFAYFELTAHFANPAARAASSIERWRHVDTPVLDLRQGRCAHALLPTLESALQTKGRSGIVAALNAEPESAREIAHALPHLEAVVFPVHCADRVTRLLMWVVDPDQTISAIAPSATGLAFALRSDERRKVGDRKRMRG
ncbi:hypothetical protein [Burkholderia cenocepacia]|uniref:Uncharacterized protein n=1 Tax=Burkholderia cenocepacia TaxID=95486 RepID=A0A3S9N688_9BURK|nr:hypothetical protein [Burkholderia cenocepacia]AZQ51190.1 hypothetical protein D5R55_09335 [Burkholderia cenocepacia]